MRAHLAVDVARSAAMLLTGQLKLKHGDLLCTYVHADLGTTSDCQWQCGPDALVH